MGGGTLNKTARDKLYHYFHDQFRFGQLTGIEQDGKWRHHYLANEQEGNNVRYSNMVFGQGMEQTMVRLQRHLYRLSTAGRIINLGW